jgi:pimeloyl-ACP methyl ester carboxylesterase
MDTSMAPSAPVVRLERPGGRIAYAVRGTGPLVVCSAGMGDLRSSFRGFTPGLVAEGYRVAEADLRGHGDSDTTFERHGDEATAEDLLALVEHLGGPAVLVGSSMSAGAALWAAAERPAAVAGVVLLGPFVRDAAVPRLRAAAIRAAIRLALLRPWGPAAWARTYRSFAVGRDHRTAAERAGGAPVTGRLPVWFDQHVAEVSGALRDPARLRSLRDLVGRLRHDVVEARLDEVRTPVLALMGAQDPDFADPAAELAFVEDRLTAAGAPVRGVLVPECGHYPHLQRPDVTIPEVTTFLATLPRQGDAWSATGDAGA